MRRAARLVAAVAALAAGCGGGGPDGAGRRPAPAPGAGGQAINGPVAPVNVTPSRQAVPILMYHVIGTPRPGVPNVGLWVSPEAFRAQVAALAGAGFEAVTLDTVLDAWQGRARLPAHPVVLSFDDGYFGQGGAAATALRERGWPGVLNLVLHALGSPGGLTAGRIRQMIDDGWEVDAHSLTHPDLTTLDAVALRHELAGSRAAIRRRFGVAADAFCYPAGKFDARVEAAVRAAGYRAATTELPGAARPGGDPYALPRVRVSHGDTPGAVLAAARAAIGSGA